MNKDFNSIDSDSKEKSINAVPLNKTGTVIKLEPGEGITLDSFQDIDNNNSHRSSSRRSKSIDLNDSLKKSRSNEKSSNVRDKSPLGKINTVHRVQVPASRPLSNIARNKSSINLKSSINEFEDDLTRKHSTRDIFRTTVGAAKENFQSSRGWHLPPAYANMEHIIADVGNPGTKEKVILWLAESGASKVLDSIQIIFSLLAVVLYVLSTDTSLSAEAQYQIFISELVLAFVFSFDYILHFWIAERKIEFIVNPFSIIDIITIVPVFAKVFASKLTLNFNFLRFVRVMRITRILRSYRLLYFSKEEGVGRQISTMIFTITSMVFVSSGILHYFENEAQGITFWESFYMVIITVTTVGYGDYNPITFAGQTFTVFLLVITLILIPLQTSKLVSLVRVKSEYDGTVKFPSHNGHVMLIASDLSYSTVQSFLHEYYHEDHLKQHNRMVFLCSSIPNRPVKNLLRSSKYMSRVTWLKGTAMNEKDLIRTRAQDANAVFLISNQFAEDRQREDMKTVLSFISIKRMKPDMKCFVSLLYAKNKHHLSGFLIDGIDHLISMDEFKMHLLAKSCTTPGFSTIISVLTRSHSSPASLNVTENDEKDTATELTDLNLDLQVSGSSSDEEEEKPGKKSFRNRFRSTKSTPHTPNWLREFGHGAGFEVYNVVLPLSLKGTSYVQLTGHISEKFESFIFAANISMKNGTSNVIINPGPSYIIQGQELVFIMSQDQKTAMDILRYLQQISVESLSQDHPLASILPLDSYSTGNNSSNIIKSEPIRNINHTKSKDPLIVIKQPSLEIKLTGLDENIVAQEIDFEEDKKIHMSDIVSHVITRKDSTSSSSPRSSMQSHNSADDVGSPTKKKAWASAHMKMKKRVQKNKRIDSYAVAMGLTPSAMDLKKFKENGFQFPKSPMGKTSSVMSTLNIPGSFGLKNFSSDDLHRLRKPRKLISEIIIDDCFELKDHIVVSGSWLGLDYFVQPLRVIQVEEIIPIVFLFSDPMPSVLWQKIKSLPEIYLVVGSSTDSDDLTRANVSMSSRCIILNDPSHHDSEEDYMVDAKSILTYLAISRTSSFSNHSTAEIIYPSNINFLTTGNENDQYHKSTTWKPANYALLSPLFASGSVYSNTYLNALLCQAYYNPFLPEIIEKMVVDLEDHSLVTLINIPEGFLAEYELTKRTFGKLFDYLLYSEDCLLTLGLYRVPSNACDSQLGFVFLGPLRTDRINEDDLVYVAHPPSRNIF